MKVKELVKELQFADPEAEIHFAALDADLSLLSIYSDGEHTVDENNVTLSEINKKSKHVYIDLS